MDQKCFLDLLEKVRNGNANQEEILELENLYEQFDQRPGFTQELSSTQKIAYGELMYNDIHAEIQSIQQLKKLKSQKYKFIKFSIAASLLFLVGIAAYIYTIPRSGTRPEIIVAKPPVTGDPNSRPVLILSSGRRINLDSIDSGILSAEGGITIRKTGEGLISYENTNDGGKDQKIGYNSIEIPRGQTYQIKLPDGTKVNLNSVSSLRYPSVFATESRTVELVGEAYFEVTPDKKKPFIVKTVHQMVEVLGTHFNVNSYDNESVTKTTLVEGRVKVIHNNKSVILRPGEEARLDLHSNMLNILTADVEGVLAWQKGVILFENADIRTIMRLMSRKYDIDVEYRGQIPNHKFGGAFQQSTSLKEILKYLESYGELRFELQGRRVIVMK